MKYILRIKFRISVEDGLLITTSNKIFLLFSILTAFFLIFNYSVFFFSTYIFSETIRICRIILPFSKNMKNSVFFLKKYLLL